jgi:hypothetical protein
MLDLDTGVVVACFAAAAFVGVFSGNGQDKDRDKDQDKQDRESPVTGVGGKQRVGKTLIVPGSIRKL